jgi:hypothetical protein
MLLGATSSFAIVGCRHDPYDDAEKSDSIDAYQHALKAQPSDTRATHAHERLVELRFAEAREAHTALAYKRFLQDFPTSDQAVDAQKLLEALRFDSAEQEHTPQGYAEFLRDHPDGAHAAQARAQLDSLRFAEAKQSHSAATMRAFVDHFPESPRHAEAERLADDWAFEAAQKEGAVGLSRYLQQAPEGGHREAARVGLLFQEIEARAATGDLAGALELAKRVPGPEAQALAIRLEQDELEQVGAQLDPDALKTFLVKHPDGEAGAEARSLAAELQKKAKLVKALRTSAEKLDPNSFGRPPDELIAALSATDPRDRWQAAEELGSLGAQQALDPLLETAASSRFSEVRTRAFASLQQLFARMGPGAAEVQSRQRQESLRKTAQGPLLFLKLAMLEELSGAHSAAATDYQRSLRGDSQDFLALRRLTTLQQLDHMNFQSAISARRLAVELLQETRDRSTGEGAGDPPLLASRWYCGAVHDARAARDTLAAIPEASVKDFPEDLESFRQKADEAVRVAQAKLSDAESLARANQTDFQPCDVDDVAPRLADGVKSRLSAVEELARSKDPLAAWPLRLTARRDPSAEVREAAQKALSSVMAKPAG